MKILKFNQSLESNDFKNIKKIFLKFVINSDIYKLIELIIDGTYTEAWVEFNLYKIENKYIIEEFTHDYGDPNSLPLKSYYIFDNKGNFHPIENADDDIDNYKNIKNKGKLLLSFDVDDYIKHKDQMNNVFRKINESSILKFNQLFENENNSNTKYIIKLKKDFIKYIFSLETVEVNYREFLRIEKDWNGDDNFNDVYIYSFNLYPIYRYKLNENEYDPEVLSISNNIKYFIMGVYWNEDLSERDFYVYENDKFREATDNEDSFLRQIDDDFELINQEEIANISYDDWKKMWKSVNKINKQLNENKKEINDQYIVKKFYQHIFNNKHITEMYDSDYILSDEDFIISLYKTDNDYYIEEYYDGINYEYKYYKFNINDDKFEKFNIDFSTRLKNLILEFNKDDWKNYEKGIIKTLKDINN